MTRALTAEQIRALEHRHPEERRRIRDAAEQLVAGHGPRPTIEDLRVAAAVSARWVLTTRHVDLKSNFLSRVESRWGRDAPGQATLQRKIDDLQGRYDRLRVRSAELEELVETYAAVIEELGRQVAALDGSPRAVGIHVVD